MSFLTRIANGDCSVCFSNLGSDAVAHQDGGEQHPIHRQCLELWVEAQWQRNQVPFCPTCRIAVTSIETKQSSLIRMAQKGDLASLRVLLNNGSSWDYDIAVLTASEGGHHPIVEALLEKGRISDAFRGLALVAASRNGSFEIVETLFVSCGNNETVPTDSLEKSLNIARKKGYQRIIEKLEPLVQMVQMHDIFGQNGDIRSEVFPERFHRKNEWRPLCGWQFH